MKKKIDRRDVCIFLLFFLLVSCTDIERIRESLNVQSELVGNMRKNDLLLTEAYIEQLNKLIHIIDANRDAKIAILSNEPPNNSEESAFLAERIKKIHEIASRQKDAVREKIDKTKALIEIGRKNYIDYKKINDDLLTYIDTLSKTTPEEIFEE